MLRRNWAFMLVAALALTACEGPQGPAGPTGPAGPAGPAGPQGPAGPAGTDASSSCTDCHVDDLTLVAKQAQFASSTHDPSGYYVRNSGECVACHTHQGFLSALETGSWNYPESYVSDAQPMNCRTCHQIHTTYTESDYAFTVTGSAWFKVGDTHIDVGSGSGNLCASCHQQRERSGQMPVIDGDDVTFTSTHWGPHYGTQGNMFVGHGFFDFTGELGGPMSHATDDRANGCATCHMAESRDMDTGGHTYRPATEGCETCHTETDDFDKFGGQTRVHELLDELGALLEAEGILDADHHAVPGTYSANVAAAAWNFMGVYNDGSLGVHNPHYIIGLLEGSIEALGG